MAFDKKIIYILKLLWLPFFLFVCVKYFAWQYIESPSEWVYVALIIFIFLGGAIVYRAIKSTGLLSSAQFTVNIGLWRIIISSMALLLAFSILLLLIFNNGTNLQGAWTLLINVIYLFGVYGLLMIVWYVSGRQLLSVLKIDIKNRLGQAVLAIIFGQLLTILFFYILSLGQIVSSLSMLLYVIIFIAVGFPYLPEIFRCLKKKYTLSFSLNFSHQATLKTLLLVTIVIYCIFVFISTSTLRPLDTDSAKTYAYVPYQIVQSGGVVDFPHAEINRSAFSGSYLYLPLIFSGPQAIVYINIIFFLILIGSLYYFTEKYWGIRTAVLSVFLFLTMDLIFLFMITAKPDLLMVSVVLWSVVFLWRFMEAEQSKALYLSGVLLGMAVAIKYNAIIIVPGMTLLLLLNSKKLWKQRVANILQFYGASLLAFSPWGIVSYLKYQSIFYPFGLTGKYLFLSQGAEQMRSLISRELSAHTHLLSPGNNIWRNVYLLAVNQTNYGTNKIGPILFGAMPLLFLYRISDWSRQLLIVILPSVAVWYVISVSQVWYMLHVLPLIWILIAAAVCQIKRKSIYLVMAVMVTFLLISNVRISNLYRVNTLYAGSYTTEALVRPPSIEAYINDTISQEEPNYLIMPIGDIDSYAIQDHYLHVYDNDFFISWLPYLADHQEADKIINALQADGITHIYYSKELIGKLKAPICEVIPCPTLEKTVQSVNSVVSLLPIAKESPNWTLYKIP